MFMATMLEVFFPPDYCDYPAVDMGHPFSLSKVTCLAPAGGACGRLV